MSLSHHDVGAGPLLDYIERLDSIDISNRDSSTVKPISFRSK